MTSDRPRAWNSTLSARTSGLTRTPFPRQVTSLERHAGLRSVPATGTKRAQPRRSPSLVAAFSPEVRKLIRERAASSCEACGVFLPAGYGQIQHRVARGMGGSRNAVLGSPVNGVLLCGTPASGCHGKCEARDPELHEAGMWLWQHENPAEVPVLLSSIHGSGCLVWLTPEGGYSVEPPEGGAA